MKNHLFRLMVLLSLGAGLAFLPGGCARNNSPQASGKHAGFHCPMHPSVMSGKPGDCPICGMKLVPLEGITVGTNRTSAVPDRAAVSLAPEVRQRMGLTLGTVEKRMVSRHIRTSARIVADETRLVRVTTKVEGWVDKLLVSVTGQAVHKGDPLLTLYSPQLVSAQQEYLNALQAASSLAAGTSGEAVEGARRLMDSARQRLLLWDIGNDQIDRLEKTRLVEKTMTLVAPSDGFVMEKTVLAGQKIMPGDSLLVVADLSVVWGEADLYEIDLPYVKTGMPLSISLPYWPEKTFRGNVSFLAPALDRETRTLKIRLEIPNPELLLKLEMYADARLDYSLGECRVAPESAILRTGERSYAFVDSGAGKLTPVEVKVGGLNDGAYEIRSGLNAGDRVVTSATFLVDSESSMRAALEALTGH